MSEMPNCENCPSMYGDKCPIKNPTDRSYTFRITQITGCLFHPNTRAWLMKDTIIELEKRRIECSEKGNSNEKYANYALAYAYAIHIIESCEKKSMMT